MKRLQCFSSPNAESFSVRKRKGATNFFSLSTQDTIYYSGKKNCLWDFVNARTQLMQIIETNRTLDGQTTTVLEIRERRDVSSVQIFALIVYAKMQLVATNKSLTVYFNVVWWESSLKISEVWRNPSAENSIFSLLRFDWIVIDAVDSLRIFAERGGGHMVMFELDK